MFNFLEMIYNKAIYSAIVGYSVQYTGQEYLVYSINMLKFSLCSCAVLFDFSLDMEQQTGFK